MSEDLLEVQKTRRSGARAALETARRHEQAARDAEEQAVAECQAAQAEWAALVSSPGFWPEYSRVLAERVIERDADAAQAAARTFAAAELCAGRRHDWQGLETQVRMGERSLRSLKRKLDRHDEEQRLNAVADLITHASRRR